LTKGIASVLQSDAYTKRKHLLKVQETSVDIPDNQIEIEKEAILH
jgi:hypothetical protein